MRNLRIRVSDFPKTMQLKARLSDTWFTASRVPEQRDWVPNMESSFLSSLENHNAEPHDPS